jgi:flagellar hook-associated protein 2
MAGVISVGGLASGLDTESIITKLVALEQRPIDLLQQQVADVQKTQGSISSLSSKLSTLRTAAFALRTASGVLVRKATSSDSTVVAAAAGLGAQRGTATVSVSQLARGSVAGSTVGVAGTASTVANGTGTFQFKVGSGDVQTIGVTDTTTLQELADAITGVGAGVTASAVNLGTAAAPDYRLQLVSTSTGASSTITILHDDTHLAVQTSQAGQNANFTVDGFTGTFERESNTFSDVLLGVTFTLHDTGTSTVTVSDDTDEIVKRAQALTTAFNDVVGFVSNESTVQESADKSQLALGSLATDTTARRIVDRLHDLFSAPLTGTTTRFVNLSSVGFATQRDGTIAFDEAAFRSGLDENAGAVAEVFAGNDGGGNGIARDLTSFIDQATGAGGAIEIRNQGLDDQVQSLQDEISSDQVHLTSFEANLRTQFNALETLVSGLQSQASFLASAFPKA